MIETILWEFLAYSDGKSECSSTRTINYKRETELLVCSVSCVYEGKTLGIRKLLHTLGRYMIKFKYAF